MNDRVVGAVGSRAVTAIAQVEGELKAVRLSRRGGTIELVWARSADSGQTDLKSFAVKSGLAVRAGTPSAARQRDVAVVGFDSAGVVFYRLAVPAVKEAEVAAMVRLQAEARLPLPVEQMEIAWRKDRERGGQAAVTVAAGRTEQLQGFVEDVRGFRPSQILLDSQGIAKVWQTLFSENDETAVVVSVQERSTRICLVEGGRLVNGASLDMGMEDFSASPRSAQHAETAERFAQDMTGVLELFGYTDTGSVGVFVLSDGGKVIEGMVSSLVSAGLSARAALPKVKKLKSRAGRGAGDIYEYRVPIGLALMGLEGQVGQLNVFERLYERVEEKARERWFRSLKATAVVAAVTAVLFVLVFYALDAASYRRFERLEGSADLEQLMDREELIKEIARRRPDLLGLLSEINSIEGKGILLDSFSFKMGQPAVITGQADNRGQLHQFEKSLEQSKGVSSVKMTPSQDSKGDKIRFTMSFHYWGFTKKQTRK
jgi:hypothetical protein